MLKSRDDSTHPRYASASWTLHVLTHALEMAFKLCCTVDIPFLGLPRSPDNSVVRTHWGATPCVNQCTHEFVPYTSYIRTNWIVQLPTLRQSLTEGAHNLAHPHITVGGDSWFASHRGRGSPCTPSYVKASDQDIRNSWISLPFLLTTSTLDQQKERHSTDGMHYRQLIPPTKKHHSNDRMHHTHS